MVVKMSARDDVQKPPKQYIGNHQEINIQCNNSETTIIGNRNRINVEVNNGTVNVIGNHCTVRMASGTGSILYTGNHGNVSRGDGVLEEQIVNVGESFKMGGKEKEAKKSGSGEGERQLKTKKVHKCVRRIRVNYVNVSF